MSSRNDQNGRQPPLPGQPPPQSEVDSLSENESDNKKEICRNFVWGTCNKSAQCKFRHELDFDEMKKILKFCHDYQNPPGCSREHCSYLHTTKEEESLFFATGQLPRVLEKRHASMSVTAAETIPQIALFIQESLAGHMPPPPPPPAPVSAPPLPAPVTMPVTRTAPMLPIQQLLPPPPPPTVPATPVVPQTPIFTAPPPLNASTFPAASTSSNFPKFDGSRPPPPLPLHVQKNGSIKRTSQNQFDAQPCKIRKSEDEKVADALCDQCEQRGIRVELYRQEMNKLHREEECQALIYKQKLSKYQNMKDILRSLVSSDVYHLIEQYLESFPQLEIHDVLANLNQPSTFVPGTSTTTLSNQLFMQLLDCALNSRRNYESVTSTSSRLDESLLHALMPLRRNDTATKSDLQTFVEILKQSDTERTSSDFNVEILKNISGSNNGNGIHCFSEGQKTDVQARLGQQFYTGSQYGRSFSAPPVPPAPPKRHYLYPPPISTSFSGAMGSSQLVPRAPPPPAPPAPPAPPVPPATPAPYAVASYPPPFYQRHQ